MSDQSTPDDQPQQPSPAPQGYPSGSTTPPPASPQPAYPPPPPPPPYPQGAYPPPPPGGYAGYGGDPGTSGKATTALILGLVGVLLCGLAGIVAIVIGGQARREIRQTGQRGDGMAFAGIILGWIAVALMVALIAFIVFGSALVSSSG